MSDHHFLFVQKDFSAHARSCLRDLRDKVRDHDDDNLIQRPIEDLVDYFMMSTAVTIPSVLPDAEITQSRASDSVITESHKFFGDIEKVGTKITFRIPFQGPRAWFEYRANQGSTMQPYGEARGGGDGGEIYMDVKGVNLDGREVKRLVESNKMDIIKHLEWLRKDADKFNNEAEDALRRLVCERRKKILTDRKLEESTGYPMQRRRDTSMLKLPKKRAPYPKLKIAKSSGFAPEPKIYDECFDHIIRVIKSMAIFMELMPGVFAKLNENAIRAHILLQLNGHYEGNATGETFRMNGKTDILIEHDGKHLFTAECKKWRGPKSLQKAIDQLLGYVSWRDAKITIVLLVDNKGFSNVLGKVKASVSDHPSFKRFKSASDCNDLRCAFRNPNDNNKELDLAVVSFNIPKCSLSKSAPQERPSQYAR